MHLCKARSVSVFGRRSPQVSTACTSLAAALISLEDYIGAAEQLREAESICEQRGWMDPEGGGVHIRLEELATKQGRHGDALERFERGLALLRRFYPADHHLVVSALRYVGEAQSALGMADEAHRSLTAADLSTRRSQVHCAGPNCKLNQRHDGAPLDQCAGCLRTYCCSVACQAADWKRKGGHKAECKALAAEGRAGAAAAGSARADAPGR